MMPLKKKVNSNQVKKIFIAGHNGMVGSAIYRKIYSSSKKVNLITASRSELDLTSQKEVSTFFADNKIDQVYLAAAKVGGIYANDTYPAEFIYDNLMIQSNVIDAAYKNNVKQLIFFGSSCIYPKMTAQPIREESILSGKLEPTNEPYAIAKIAGIKMCESYNRQYGTDFRSIMPTNLYGEGDNYNQKNSHVIPALINKFHNAKTNNISSVEVWGTGEALREFLHVNDLADAALFIANLPQETLKNVYRNSLSHINVGSGYEVSISKLVDLISNLVNYDGKVKWNLSMPDGTPRKIMDSSKINNLGWKPSINLEEGLELTYKAYLENIDNIRK